LKLNLNITYKYLFIISILWLLLDGILRKWFLFQFAGPLFYVKYILFGLSYASFILSKNSIPKVRYIYQYFIILFILICFLGVLNNKLENPSIVGIVGLIVHIYFMPIIHLNQFIFKNLNAIDTLSKVIAYLSIPICILGMVQFYLPTDHIINGFTNEAQLITRVGDFTRISSVFSFVKIYNAYLLFCITFLTVVILNKLLQNKKSILLNIILILLIINMFMTGSRLPLVLMFMNLFIIGIYVLISFPSLRKTVSVVTILAVMFITTLYLTTSLVADPIDATIGRFEQAESRHKTESTGYTDVQLRMTDRLDIFKFSESAGFFGYGIGTTYQGNAAVIKDPIPFYFEEEGERIVLEIGIIGGIILILMRLSILFFAFKILKWCKSVEIKLLLLGLIVYIIPPVLTIKMTTYSYLENFFYYFAIGLIIALYKIHQNKIQEK